MSEQSYYRNKTKKIMCPTLKKDLHCDVVIVGGGLTGIISAYYLKDTGLNIVVVEGDCFLSKSSGKTTGKVTCLHGLMYQDIEKHYNIDTAKKYYQSNLDALEEVKRIIDVERIRCNARIVSHFVYSNDCKNEQLIHKEYELLKKIGANVCNKIPKGIKASSCLSLDKQLIFDPVLYGQALMNKCLHSGVRFYEHSKVTKIEEVDLHHQIHCNDHIISSAYTIVATRYPIPIGIHNYILQLQQSISYLYYVKKNIDLQDSYYCVDHKVTSFRVMQDGYFYGGYGHDVGTKFVTKKDMELDCHKLFGKYPSMSWSTQDCMSNRILPYIGYYHHEQVPCFVACGYNKWGMTLSHVAAKVIRDLIVLKDSTYKELYDPLNNRYKIILNKGLTATKHLLQGYIIKRISYSNTCNEANQHALKHVIKPICSHAGGVLCYNANSKTWDCINHGARFDLDGTSLEMPAIDHLKYKE